MTTMAKKGGMKGLMRAHMKAGKSPKAAFQAALAGKPAPTQPSVRKGVQRRGKDGKNDHDFDD